ncbi:hypothetical protein J5226_00395 [Lysobacter sp. K5869]|uniref:hypothetical protein n=1 Tax=Lysobacter sp. K5869 TaxID=2820808 RepID=UPI001C05FBCC|nr:hypothetical protein [Lysobacter sp. K5869]QWP76909.1 hypothetical protein J5226_00395 [Lysobacter sp. K5869]
MDAHARMPFSPVSAAGALALGIALSLGAGCARDPAPAAAPAAPAAPAKAPAKAQPASAAPGALAADLAGLRLEPLSALPAPPKEDSADVAGDCSVEPESAEARAAVANGWKVFGEREWRGYRVVGVAAAPGVLAGMGCTSGGGRLLFFRGGEPVAQVFEPGARAAEGDSGVQGFDKGEESRPRGDDETLTVFDWAVQRARVRAEDGALRLIALPALDKYCGGRAAVPRVEGVALPQARERLLAHGWRAAPPEREEPGFVSGLIHAGYPEVEDCAGTGQGFCSFAYRNEAGDRLTLVTAGEWSQGDKPGDEAYWPHARHAGVECAGAAAEGTGQGGGP